VVTAVAVATSTTLILAVLHNRVHQSTDDLLLQMARQDVAHVDAETDVPVHVHDTMVSVPMTADDPLHRYALVADGCDILTTTKNLTIRRLPDRLCGDPLAPGTHRHETVADLTGHELRIVMLGARTTDGRELRYLVGVDHARIDSALWGTTLFAVPASLVVIALIVGAAWLGTRPITRDLRRLADAGDALVAGAVDWRHADSPQFSPGAAASQEVVALARSLDLLLSNVRQSHQTQARFVATASHELRTPLTALVGELEVALRRERSAEAYRQTLTELSSDAQRLVALAERLLAAARAEAESVTVHPTDVVEIAADALSRNQALLASAGIDARLTGLSSPVSALCHHLSLGQVLDNLIHNATRHSRARTLELNVDRRDGEVVLTIRDDGRGIPEAVRPHLFRPFQRAPDEHGHGLGLYIAAELMRRQSGALELRDGPGACWEVRLPEEFAANVG